MSPLTAWVLAAMLVAQPSAPWEGTYPSTARVLAQAAEAEPLFAGPEGPKRTAALLVSVAWFESRFDAQAVGDHGTSVCLFQINETNFAGLHVTRDQLVDKEHGPETCTAAAMRMLKASFRVCRSRPLEERLGWYAAGGPDCSRGLRASSHRVRKAMWLYAHVQVSDAPTMLTSIADVP